MNATTYVPAGTRAPDPMRRTARIAGVLYLLTFVSIPTLGLYQPVKDEVGTFVLGRGGSTGLMWGAVSEVVVGLAGIGTAVVLVPVLKRQSETAALGIVTARVVETSLIFVGVISLLSITPMRDDVVGAAGTDPASLVGAPLLLASDIAIFFGVYDRVSPVAAVAFIPIAVWEFSLGIWLVTKGFNPAAVAALTSTDRTPALSPT